jgi:hypothetical protein
VTAPAESANQHPNAFRGTTDMAEHKHGEMDITVQEKTFEGFIKAASWVAGISIFILIFMALVNG